MQLFLNFMMTSNDNKISTDATIFFVLLCKSNKCYQKVSILKCKQSIKDKVNISKSININLNYDETQFTVKKFMLLNNKLTLLADSFFDINDLKQNDINNISLHETPIRTIDVDHDLNQLNKTIFLYEPFHLFEMRNNIIGNLYIELSKSPKFDLYKFDTCSNVQNMYMHNRKNLILIRNPIILPSNPLFDGLGLTDTNIIKMYINTLRKLKATSRFLNDTYYDTELVNTTLDKQPEELAIAKFKSNKRNVVIEKYSNTINAVSDGLVLTFDDLDFSTNKNDKIININHYIPSFLRSIFKNGNGFMTTIGLQDHRRLVMPYDGKLLFVQRVNGDLVLIFKNDTHVYPDFLEPDFKSIFYGHRIGSSVEDPSYMNKQPNNTLYWSIILSSNFDVVNIYDNKKLSKLIDFNNNSIQQIKKDNWFKRGEDLGGISFGVSNIFILSNRKIIFREIMKICNKIPIYLEANEIFGDIN